MLVIVPVIRGMATTVTVAVPPFASPPRLQATTPPASAQVPWLGAARPKTTDAGKVSVSRTVLATEGPLLWTTRV